MRPDGRGFASHPEGTWRAGARSYNDRGFASRAGARSYNGRGFASHPEGRSHPEGTWRAGARSYVGRKIVAGCSSISLTRWIIAAAS